jgi:hypothetical protein
MTWVRSIFAIFLGYAVVLAVIFPGYTALEWAMPSVHGSTSGLLLLVLIACVGGVLGGLVAATVAPHHRRVHAAVLGVVVLLLGLALVVASGPAPTGEPAWYHWGLPILALPSAIVGGLLRRGNQAPYDRETDCR